MNLTFKVLLFLPWIISMSMGQRLISTAPVITDYLAYFGVEEKIVGVSDFCSYSKTVCLKTKVGTSLSYNLEKLISLQPDLVFLQDTSSGDLALKLKKLKIKTVSLKFNRLNDIFESIKMIGREIGKKAKAQKLIAQIEGKLQSFPQFFRSESIMIVIGTTISHGKIASAQLAGKETYLNDIITYSAHENIGGKELAYPVYDRELIMKKNPERIWVVLVKEDREAIKAWKSFSGLQAVKNKKLKFLIGNWAVVPGPRIFKLIDEVKKSF